MSQILFIIGAGLLVLGKLRLGEIESEGPPVRAAGFMLMLPLIVTLFLSFVTGLLTGGDTETMESILRILWFVELPVMIVCVGVAYWLIYKSPQNITLFPTNSAGTQTDQSDDAQPSNTVESSAAPAEQVEEEKPAPKPEPVRRAPSRPRADKSNFPSVMSIDQAAQYLNTTEQGVMDLINEGKITAARINYRYRISRTVLDDFIQEQRQAGSESS